MMRISGCYIHEYNADIISIIMYHLSLSNRRDRYITRLFNYATKTTMQVQIKQALTLVLNWKWVVTPPSPEGIHLIPMSQVFLSEQKTRHFYAK